MSGGSDPGRWLRGPERCGAGETRRQGRCTWRGWWIAAPDSSPSSAWPVDHLPCGSCRLTGVSAVASGPGCLTGVASRPPTALRVGPSAPHQPFLGCPSRLDHQWTADLQVRGPALRSGGRPAPGAGQTDPGTGLACAPLARKEPVDHASEDSGDLAALADLEDLADLAGNGRTHRVSSERG